MAEKAESLVHYGLRWIGGWNWTEFTPPDFQTRTSRAGCVAGDICAAVGADLFAVYALPEQGLTTGAAAEFGARISHSREAHVILNESEDHLFFHHPCVIRHDDWDAFMVWAIKHLSLVYKPKPSERLPKVVQNDDGSVSVNP
jgi:hypothetical protein